MIEMELLGAITDGFLQPTMNRLSEQLQRRIELAISLKMPATYCEGKVISGKPELTRVDGAVRIVASDTAIPDRYKYELQCLFSDEGLDGFSGVRLKGTVRTSPNDVVNDYSGFIYTYNDWAWAPKLRDF